MRFAYTRNMATKDERRTKHTSIPLRMPQELKTKVDQASDKLNLAQQDVMRLSLERGLEILVAQLTTPVVSAPAQPAAA